MIRLIFSFMLIVGLGFILIQIVNFYLSINSGKAKVREDVAELKSKIATYLASLIPMDANEMALLSAAPEINTSRSGLTSVKYGAFNSIYHEPLVAFAYKKYAYPADKSILLVSTDVDDFLYMTNGMVTEVYINDRVLGEIDPKGNMYAPNSKERIAHIEMNHQFMTHPVKVMGREVGEIINARSMSSPNSRAYQFLDRMSKQESEIFQALTFLSLIEETVTA